MNYIKIKDYNRVNVNTPEDLNLAKKAMDNLFDNYSDYI